MIGDVLLSMDKLLITGGEKLQEYFFKKSINDNPSFFGNPIKFDISIDHISGVNYLNGVKYPLLFPKDMVDLIHTLSKDKTMDYYFKGVISDNRKWIMEYEDRGTIINSFYGRNPSTKYILDEEYYKGMCGSRFTLTPTGDCPWSYRFFESILCFSIPILGDDEDDIYAGQFKYYRNKDVHVYDYDMARYNYDVMIKNFTSL
jgi:hypothetical protein